MSYPTTSAGYSLASSSGVTTLLWGTDGLLVTPAPGGSYAGTGFYIVESVDQETDVDVIHGENGTGQKAWRVIINNGQKFTISVQDDAAMTSPAVGSTISINDGANLLGGGRVSYTCRVVASGEKFTRKSAAMRNITAEKLALID
jgi:hypothetical protein